VPVATQAVDARHTLLSRVAEARRQTDKLFDLIRPDALYDRPIPERHRIVFYLGHLEAFDWNLLQPRLPELKVFDSSLDRLFAFGIDPVDGGLPADLPADWPAESQVRQYQQQIRGALDQALVDASFPDWFTLMNVAIEHRLMHAETLAYMLHQLPLDRKREEPQVTVSRHGAPKPETIDIPEGMATLGLSSEDTTAFGWDNEYEAQESLVPAFAIDRYKVTNGEFLKFVLAGGYRDRALWTPADWDWKSGQGIAHPLGWRLDGPEWRLRTMFEEIPLPLDWPVYVSHAEARAYAAWAGKRLPTEAEWQRAAQRVSTSPGPRHGYFDLERWDPFPVNAVPDSRSAFGVDGLLANGWEWTSSPFEPFAGFKPFPFYEGYSANFFDGLHYVMKGGSTRTERSMLRPSFRNWFQPHYQYVYAGFRCAK
jgi:gamma-glutamyl hercynylcysteine S-oxide synthase